MEASSAKSDDEPLDGNYVVTLFPAGQEGAKFAIVTATQSFGIANEKEDLRFNATLFTQSLVGRGMYRLEYRLANFYRTVETASSVALRLGEPVQITKNGKLFYNLRLDHYPVAEPAENGGHEAKGTSPDANY